MALGVSKGSGGGGEELMQMLPSPDSTGSVTTTHIHTQTLVVY